MLSVADYKQLKLLYDKFEKFSMLIKDLAQKNDWDSVEQVVSDKGQLMNQIIFFERPRLQYIKENDELMKIRNNIIELEKNNITLITQLRTKLLSELNQVKMSKRLLNAYEPATNRTKSTFEIEQED